MTNIIFRQKLPQNLRHFTNLWRKADRNYICYNWTAPHPREVKKNILQKSSLQWLLICVNFWYSLLVSHPILDDWTHLTKLSFSKSVPINWHISYFSWDMPIKMDLTLLFRLESSGCPIGLCVLRALPPSLPGSLVKYNYIRT